MSAQPQTLPPAWTKTGPGQWHSAAGYKITAHITPDGWCYSAWAPPLSKDEYESQLKVRYERNEMLPMMVPIVGYFTDPESARRACAEHQRLNHKEKTHAVEREPAP